MTGPPMNMISGNESRSDWLMYLVLRLHGVVSTEVFRELSIGRNGSLLGLMCRRFPGYICLSPNFLSLLYKFLLNIFHDTKFVPLVQI